MTLRIVRFASLFLVALILGLAFCHVMEIPGKLRLSGPEWLTVQHNLYIAFGVPLGAGLELASIALCWLLVAMVRGRQPAFGWTLAAALSVTAGLVDWFLLVSPMNAVLSAWTAETLPPQWTGVRDQWELGHAIHAAFFALGFAALLVAILAETPSSGYSDRSGNRAPPRG
jgi:Domain of unknown function (DUF1772).